MGTEEATIGNTAFSNRQQKTIYLPAHTCHTNNVYRIIVGCHGELAIALEEFLSQTLILSK